MPTKKNNEFKIGEIVVYPKHGVGEITKTESMEIAKIKTKKMKKKWSYYVPKSYLSYQINDLRDEYGILVLTEKELML